MNALFGLSSFVSQISAGSAQRFRNLAVIPLTAPAGYSEPYMSLDEATEKNLIDISEVSAAGAVGNLKVHNAAGVPVLMLDGEELIGAKQNRILNTSILVAAGSDVFIPVSCVEQGRWSYRSKKFRPSDTVFFSRGRQAKYRDVSRSAMSRGDFASEQGKVWDSVAEINFQMGAKSDTGAMRASFDKSKTDLDSFIENLPSFDGQNGMLVFIDGRIAGCDVITNEGVFRNCYPKLLRSYAIDALCSSGEDTKEENFRERAVGFLSAASVARTHPVKSKGIGVDLRIEEVELIGAALVVEEAPVHVALFPNE